MIARLAGLTGLALAMAFPAAAQEAAPAGPSMLEFLILPLGMIAIFYFLLIRPQQKRQKAHQEMIDAVKRGDTVVTSGGLVAKVIKVGEQELTIELADNVRVRIMRGMIADVRTKGAPAAANDTKPS